MPIVNRQEHDHGDAANADVPQPPTSELLNKLYEAAGKVVRVGDPWALAVLLYDEQALSPAEPGVYSVDAAAVAELAALYPANMVAVALDRYVSRSAA